MRSILRAAGIGACLLLLCGCAAVGAGMPAKGFAAVAAPTGAPAASVLLVSVDGLGADMLEASATPRIAALAAHGVRAEWMVPSFPSLTFPNHYTLVTGLRPDRHGIVHNDMEDASLGRFSKGAGGDGRWWEGGTPVWVSAERAGLPTATFFWPGSDFAIHGVRPTRWQPYDESVPAAERVDTMLGWLAEPAATRPRFATLYFWELDHAAHTYAPGSPEARAALASVDAAIGRLLDGLEARGLRDQVDVVLVSDHGMVEVTRAIGTDAMADQAVARNVSDGQSIGFVPLPGREAEAEAQLLGAHDGYDCWRKADLPARWRYGTHPRVPPIVCQMHPGWDALRPGKLAHRAPDAARGSHGYDPALPAMRAVFVADGPSFRDGVILPPLENVDVYPLLMRLLDLPPEPHDGDADALPALMSESGE